MSSVPDFLSPSQVRTLLAEHDLRPDHKLGQNFLVDQNILNKIIEAARISQDDLIIEIGSGLGNLTSFLISRAKEVTAVEYDRGLYEVMVQRFATAGNLKPICADVLDLDLEQLVAADGYKLIGNIPYQITSPLLRMFIQSSRPPELSVLMIQKDVADRILTRPPHMNQLACQMQYLCIVESVCQVSANCFWPRPKVASAVIKLTPHPNRSTGSKQYLSFSRLVRTGFAQKRKQLLNLLSTELDISRDKLTAVFTAIDLRTTVRAQELGLDDWIRLADHLTAL